MNIHKFISLIDENDDLPNDDDEDEDESFILLKFLRARQSCILAELNKNKNKKISISASKTNSKTDAVVAKIAERKENGKNKIVFCHYRGEIDFIKKNLLYLHSEKIGSLAQLVQSICLTSRGS